MYVNGEFLSVSEIPFVDMRSSGPEINYFLIEQTDLLCKCLFRIAVVFLAEIDHCWLSFI